MTFYCHTPGLQVEPSADIGQLSPEVARHVVRLIEATIEAIELRRLQAAANTLRSAMRTLLREGRP